MYIGKTEFSIEKRFQEHCKDMSRRQKEQRPLYAAMNKYGIEHFHICLIEETDSPEEREIYWIEKLGTFKTGYNATLGGDGTKYIDYDLVIATYMETQNQSRTAEICGIHRDSVHNILLQRAITPKDGQTVMQEQHGHIVNMYTIKEEFLRSFPSTHEAARYMIQHNLTNCKESTIRYHISEVCRGIRKTAAKYIWKFASE